MVPRLILFAVFSMFVAYSIAAPNGVITPVLLCVSDHGDQGWSAHFTYQFAPATTTSSSSVHAKRLRLTPGTSKNIVALDDEYFVDGLPGQPSEFGKSSLDATKLTDYFTVDCKDANEVTWYLGEREVSISKSDLNWSNLQCPDHLSVDFSFAISSCVDLILARSIILANAATLIYNNSGQYALDRTDLTPLVPSGPCNITGQNTTFATSLLISPQDAENVTVWTEMHQTSFEIAAAFSKSDLVARFVANMPHAFPITPNATAHMNLSSIRVRIGKPGAGPQIPEPTPPVIATPSNATLPYTPSHWEAITSDYIVLVGFGLFVIILAVAAIFYLVKWVRATRSNHAYTPLKLDTPVDA